MRRPSPLPPTLAGRAFTVLEAVEAGVSPDRLRARDLDRGIRGVRLPNAAALAERCRAALLACRDGAFICGATAADLHGMPVPPRLKPSVRHRLDVGTPGPGRAVRRRAIDGRSLRIRDVDLLEHDGLRVTTLSRTWCDLAPECTVPELVAAGDWLLRTTWLTRTRLRSAIENHPDHRQRDKLLTALRLTDAAAESPKESELRAIVALAGLPAPEVNPVIMDGHSFVARVDLLFRAFDEILEYQGDHHRSDPAQWRRDRTREAELESLGFHVMEVTNADLQHPRRLVERIIRNLRQRGWEGEATYSRWFP